MAPFNVPIERSLMIRKFLLLPLLLALAACATKGDLNLAMQDIDEMKGRLLQAEKNIAAVKVEAKEVSEKSSREALQKLENFRKGTADMQANIDAMKVDVQVIGGKVDDLGVAAKKPFDDISLLKEDTSKTIVSLDERLKKLETAQAEITAKLNTLAKALEQPAMPETAYKQAIDTFKAGEPVKAREMFNKFIEKYPGHSLSANARYWIGETYYQERNFEQAALEFQRVITGHPGKEKVPAAMLKQGLAFKELGDTKSARFILRELIEKYPKAEEIPAAKEVLQKLK